MVKLLLEKRKITKHHLFLSVFMDFSSAEVDIQWKTLMTEYSGDRVL